MSKQYQTQPRFNAAGLATGSILALVLAMATSVGIDFVPAVGFRTDTGISAGTAAQTVQASALSRAKRPG